MSGHFSGFQNRKKISEFKKSRREKLDSRKADLIDYALHNENSEIIIPVIPEEKLNRVKNNIRKRIANNKHKQAILMIAGFVIIIILLIVFAISQNVF
ncbi:MAG: hypothetical protein HC854_02650 [Flavobacterium sp.]|nr:hypothetical protein [Flavobacterium sp.]